MIVKIFINTNFIRDELTTVEINSDCSAEELLFAIKNKLKDNGLHVTNTNLLSDNGDTITKENILNFVVDNTLLVVYKSIIVPYGAHYYDFFDGIEYYFHSSEKCHLKYPHIHAKYNSEEITINLNNFSVAGQFSNRPKMNTAIKYVKKNIKSILVKWHKWVSHN